MRCLRRFRLLISAASQEQTSGIEQINQAISQMDNETQQNASLVEEAAAASEAMQNQAAKLAELVSVFRVDDRALATASRATVRAEPGHDGAGAAGRRQAGRYQAECHRPAGHQGRTGPPGRKSAGQHGRR